MKTATKWTTKNDTAGEIATREGKTVTLTNKDTRGGGVKHEFKTVREAKAFLNNR